MVDVSHLNEATGLLSQGQTIARAIEEIDAGEQITMLMIGSASVTTAGLLVYPPQMLATIRAQLDERLTQLKADLAVLGVTGDITLEVSPPEETPEPPPPEEGPHTPP